MAANIGRCARPGSAVKRVAELRSPDPPAPAGGILARMSSTVPYGTGADVLEALVDHGHELPAGNRQRQRMKNGERFGAARDGF